MSVTPNMNITLPTPEVTSGPEWANQLVDAFDNVDAHDHTAGKGVKVPVAGLNINADLEFNNNNAIELRSSRYTNHGSTLSTSLDKNCLYFVNGDLFINNNAGTSVQLTSGNAINLSTVGTIGGDYGQPGVTASATYSDTTKTFVWTQAPTQTAKMAVGDLLVYETVASATPITIKSSSGVTTGYDFFLPQSAPTANQLWRENSTATGADFVTIQGTANQLTITHAASTITASLPSTLIAPGTLSVTGNFDVATNKMTVNASSGNTAIAGDLAIATNKFTVAASSGDTAIAGTLAVTGNSTLTGDLAVNGGDITSSSAAFNLANTSTTLNLGTSATSVTIGANGSGTAFIRNIATNFTGSIDVNNKFNVASTTGTITSQGNLSLTGTISNTEGFTGNGRGIVPLGAIIAITTGLTGAMSVPSSGNTLNGYQRCDGAAIPSGQAVSGTTPNLTGSIYLRGASTYGGTGGNNTTTLLEANLPAHTHANTLSNNVVASSSHTHNISHVHNNIYQSTYTMWAWTTADVSQLAPGISGNSGAFIEGQTMPQGTSTSRAPAFSTLQNRQYYTGGVVLPPTGSDGASASSGTPSATTTVTLTNASIGSGTAFSNEPNYINVIYLMRVN